MTFDFMTLRLALFPSHDRPMVLRGSPLHAADRIDDEWLPDGEQEAHVAGAVPVGVTVPQVDSAGVRELLDQETFARAVGDGQDEVPRVGAGLVQLGLGAEDRLDAQRLRQRGDEKLRTAGDEDDVMAVPLVLLQPGHRGAGDMWADVVLHEGIGHRHDRLRAFSLKVQLALAERVQRDGRHVLQEIPQAADRVHPSHDAPSAQVVEKADLDGGAGNERVVDVEERGDPRGLGLLGHLVVVHGPARRWRRKECPMMTLGCGDSIGRVVCLTRRKRNARTRRMSARNMDEMGGSESPNGDER